MRRLLDFKPPKPSPVLIAFCKVLFPLYIRVVERLAIRFAEDRRALVQRLKNRPVAIFLNHPDREDPVVTIALARYFNEEFFCVVAREVFDWDFGLRGWFFQRIGCYSVNRGAADLRSIQTTKKILKDSRHKLVVFPEAEVTGDTLRVHEFQRSMLHLLLKTQDEMSKTEPDKSLVILPVAVNYRLESDLEETVSRTLDAVEKQLNLQTLPGTPADRRAELLVDGLIDVFSADYEFAVPKQIHHHEQIHLGGSTYLPNNQRIHFVRV